MSWFRRKPTPPAKMPLGRRKPDPAKVAKGIVDLTAALRTNVGVVPPPAEDYLAKINWAGTMWGNDAAGDCEAVRVGTWLLLITTFLGKSALRLTQDQVWAIYKTQNPGFIPGSGPHGYGSDDDQGMDTQTLLEYLVKTGLPDGTKLVGFGKVDPKNTAAVNTAVAVFGGVWVDILVLDGNQEQFSEGKPWTDDGSAVDGGHAVLGGGYTPLRKFETWEAETEFAASFWTGTTPDGPLVDAVWVPIHQDHLGTAAFLAGVDGQALSDAFTQVTGKPFPAPTPSPTPTPPVVPPAPTPVVPGTPPAYDVALAPTVNHLIGLAGTSAAAKAALTAWKKATGL